MMWEEAQGNQGKWITYLGGSFQTTTCRLFFLTQYTASLPTQFDTPIFWSDEELQELQGTAVVGLLSNFLIAFSFVKADTLG